MKNLLLLFFLIFTLNITPFAANAANSQILSDKILKSSPGWKIAPDESIVKGKTADGMSYVAAILYKGNYEDSDGLVATLRIFVVEPDQSLKLFIDAPNAICTDCGGVKGSRIPFTIEVDKNGILSLNYNGGSREQEESTTKWRYQNGDFYLIGMSNRVSDTISDPIASISRDANISTLRMIENIDLPHNHKTLTCAVPKNYQNVKLRSYSDDFRSNHMPKCSTAEL